MVIKVAVRKQVRILQNEAELRLFITVGVSKGIYEVDFGAKEVVFDKGKRWRKTVDFLQFDVPEEDFMNDKEAEGLQIRPLGRQYFEKIGRGRHFLEFTLFRRTNPDVNPISRHGHRPCKNLLGAEEVYLSLEEPFRGEVCSWDEEHEPFCYPFLAIKHGIERR